MASTHLRPVMLVIRDGWGERDEEEANGVKLANTPYDDAWRLQYPWTLVRAAEKYVGLPMGQMGNSEVGHTNLGAGFIVRQDITIIDDAIEDGSFFENQVLVEAYTHAKNNNTQLHIIGLLGSGGVHSHINHEKALLEMAKRTGLKKVFVHLFTDGRDAPPESGIDFARDLMDYMSKHEVGKVATLIGRYYAMDRDKRWERTKAAYDLLVSGIGMPSSDPIAAIKASYDAGVTDEFIKPVVIVEGEPSQPVTTIQPGDTVVFFNFRSDRGRQLTRVFTVPGFDGFERTLLQDLFFVTLTEYEKSLPVHVGFSKDDVATPLARVISDAGLTQFHSAETEKYPHVTFFFNGGRELPHPGEEWKVIPSPRDVPTYDYKPEMSAEGVRDAVLEAIESERFDFILVNYANPDMVGHTGVIPAVIKACEVVDDCTGAIVNAVLAKGGVSIVMADHGNAELMIDPETGGPHTAHTTNPVPTFLIAPANAGLDKASISLREGGKLADIAPTVLELMGLQQPPEMSGQSLIVHTDS